MKREGTDGPVAEGNGAQSNVLVTNRVQPTKGQPGGDPCLPPGRGQQARQGLSRRTSGAWTCSARASWADLACCDCGPPSPRLSRLASIAAHRHDYTWAARLRLAAQRGGQGRFCRTGGTWTCSAVFDRGAPGAAHTWSARLRVASSPQIPLPAVTVRVGRIARPEHARARDEQGTANTRATRQRPLPAVAGRGGRVVRVARGLARLVASATERVAARPR